MFSRHNSLPRRCCPATNVSRTLRRPPAPSAGVFFQPCRHPDCASSLEASPPSVSSLQFTRNQHAPGPPSCHDLQSSRTQNGNYTPRRSRRHGRNLRSWTNWPLRQHVTHSQRLSGLCCGQMCCVSGVMCGYFASQWLGDRAPFHGRFPSNVSMYFVLTHRRIAGFIYSNSRRLLGTSSISLEGSSFPSPLKAFSFE